MDGSDRRRRLNKEVTILGRKRKMKKMLLAGLSMILFTGCASTETVDLPSQTPQATQSSESKETTNRLDIIQERGTLIVATSPDYAPMEFIDTNKQGQDQYVGSEMEFARYIANQLGVKLEIKAMDFGLIMSSVDLGQVDIGMAGFGYEAERAENFELSYGYNKAGDSGCQGLMVPTDHYDDYQSLQDFANKTIIAQSGSMQESIVKQQIPDASLQLVSTLDLALMSLIGGKADAFACSCDQMMAFEKNYPDLKMSQVIFETDEEDLYAGNIMLVQKGQTEFIDYLNDIVVDINENGTFDTWHEDAKALADSLGLEFE